jgi:hypothetical protein
MSRYASTKAWYYDMQVPAIQLAVRRRGGGGRVDVVARDRYEDGVGTLAVYGVGSGVRCVGENSRKDEEHEGKTGCGT